MKGGRRGQRSSIPSVLGDANQANPRLALIEITKDNLNIHMIIATTRDSHG